MTQLELFKAGSALASAQGYILKGVHSFSVSGKAEYAFRVKAYRHSEKSSGWNVGLQIGKANIGVSHNRSSAINAGVEKEIDLGGVSPDQTTVMYFTFYDPKSRETIGLTEQEAATVREMINSYALLGSLDKVYAAIGFNPL